MKSHKPQRQDSLKDQMRTVIDLAEEAGCYDAADYLKDAFFSEDMWRAFLDSESSDKA